MDYNYLQGTSPEVPLMEERNLCSSASAFGSFQHLAYNPRLSPMSWSTTDPTVLQMNEHPWFNRVKMGSVGNIGIDADGNMIYQRPNTVTHHSQQNVPMDMMMATIPSDPFSFSGDAASHSQWNAMQMYSLSSDEYFNDTMPQLISESAAQQPCMYTSSSDCLHETDSSCSSEKDRPLSTSCLGGSSSDEINWRNSEVLQGNLGGAVAGFPLDELPDDSSSIAADLDTQDLRGYALSSLIRMPGPAGERLPLGPVSWMASSAVDVGSCSTITSVANQHLTIDPLVESVSMRSNGLLPYKRQRACYTLESIPSRPLSQPLIPSLSQSMSSKSSRADLAYPMASLNIADALCKDQVSRKQTPYLPKPAVHEVVRGFGSKRDLLDHDSRSQRKQNATSIEPQSVAARHRRKKISERVRVLEKLIPGGNKMDTASMLDESIEYVKFLQLQVQLLESLVDISEGDSRTSSPSVCKENIEGDKDGVATRISSFGSHASQSYGAPHQARPSASPLILSEILQQQLFKQKLCLVSLRQCPPANRCLASGTYS